MSAPWTPWDPAADPGLPLRTEEPTTWLVEGLPNIWPLGGPYIWPLGGPCQVRYGRRDGHRFVVVVTAHDLRTLPNSTASIAREVDALAYVVRRQADLAALAEWLALPAALHVLIVRPEERIDLVPWLFVPDPVTRAPADLIPRNPATFDPAIGWLVIEALDCGACEGRRWVWLEHGNGSRDMVDCELCDEAPHDAHVRDLQAQADEAGCPVHCDYPGVPPELRRTDRPEGGW